MEPRPITINLQKDDDKKLILIRELVDNELQNRKRQKELLLRISKAGEEPKERKDKYDNKPIIKEKCNNDIEDEDMYSFPYKRPGNNRTVLLYGMNTSYTTEVIKSLIETYSYGEIEYVEHTYNYMGEYIGTHIVFKNLCNAMALINKRWYSGYPFSSDIRVIPRRGMRILTLKEREEYKKELDDEIDNYMSHI